MKNDPYKTSYSCSVVHFEKDILKNAVKKLQDIKILDKQMDRSINRTN